MLASHEPESPLSSKFVRISSDVHSDVIKNEETKFGFYLSAVAKDLAEFMTRIPVHSGSLAVIKSKIEATCGGAYKSFIKDGERIEYYRAFTNADVESIADAIWTFLETVGGVVQHDGPSEDTPLEFDGSDFADYVQYLGLEEKSSQFTDFLVTRIRSLISNPEMRVISESTEGITLERWLNSYIGGNNAANGSITVIDLSLVPAEVVHIITAVIARMTLESLQRYRKLHKGKTLPTVLVMEEAHTFIKRYKEDAENQNAASICCQVFEKIAREGRKFGLGLVLSSQRPSELSPTVLSQCNSYLLHRISNDRDQELVHKLVPDNLRGLLRDLPSLPSRHAILLGWASELPVLVQMNALPDHQRPKSDDPDFWAVWSGTERDVDWKAVADDWQQVSAADAANDAESGNDE